MFNVGCKSALVMETIGRKATDTLPIVTVTTAISQEVMKKDKFKAWYGTILSWLYSD
jgi:hypothetical protein